MTAQAHQICACGHDHMSHRWSFRNDPHVANMPCAFVNCVCADFAVQLRTDES